ncbi:PspA/IM30 family protein [Pseudalkalibacillus caeni]|uniref:PspA/IM30 family protein n=1 Tax=Exobacillus caeni TaxID=2574798 RepID=A0A5R9F895_9BACL|nr:PspA/IM30 family protein [Pseudalkalibacillus caeni]TLS35955.1 PspA/IM30 family protein [Pseudalkalibacillus caeni]
MGSLFGRIKNSIEADFHEMLDKKEQKNPISVLNQYLRQCEQQVEKTRKLVERQYLLKDEFTREYHQAQKMVEKRKQQAEVASKAGENELYEFAQRERSQYEERGIRLKESLDSAIRELDNLEQKYEQMKHKLKDMYIKRMELMGRENVARANHGMNKVLEQETYSSKPFSKFEEIEQYLDRIEHQVNSDYHHNTIDARFAQLEKELKIEESHSIS